MESKFDCQERYMESGAKCTKSVFNSCVVFWENHIGLKLVVKRLQSIPECRCQNFYSVTWRRDINILVSNPQRDFEKFIISFFSSGQKIFYFETCLIQVEIYNLEHFDSIKMILRNWRRFGRRFRISSLVWQIQKVFRSRWWRQSHSIS